MNLNLVDRSNVSPRCLLAPELNPVHEHLAHERPAGFAHACRLGLEGIVSKRLRLALPELAVKRGLSRKPLSRPGPGGAKARRLEFVDRP